MKNNIKKGQNINMKNKLGFIANVIAFILFFICVLAGFRIITINMYTVKKLLIIGWVVYLVYLIPMIIKKIKKGKQKNGRGT